MRFLLSLATAGLVAVLPIACSPPPGGPELAPAPERVADWQAWRTAKDSLFHTDASPLFPDDRATFDSLTYFRYDSTLAFALPLDPALDRDTLRLGTSTGEVRDYVRFGILSFAFDGRRHRLTAFQPTDGTGDLFVPFADATNGRSTYSAGRYLDFAPTADGRYVLDFNYAYNPYCVYNPQYSCPLPPRENHLSIPIRAGERMPANTPTAE